MKLLKKFWYNITNIGIEEAALGREVVKARLLNQVIVLAFTTSWLALATYSFAFQGWLIIATTFVNIALESLALAMVFRRQHHLAQHVACLAFPTAVAFHVTILGINFGEANIFTGIALVAFILYEGNRKLQIGAILYICTLFIASKMYAIQAFPNAFDTKNPYDEIITFPVILVVLGLVFFLYQTELKKYEQQREEFVKKLEEKNKTLIQLNEELEQFSFIASHDLKTPLRAVSSHLDLIKRFFQQQNWAAMERHIDFAKRSSQQMYALIRDILEYKQIASNSSLSQVDLNVVLDTVLEQFKLDLVEKNAVVKCRNPLPSLLVAQHDFVALFQNLIENGLKYNRSPNPTVEIWADLTASDQLFSLFFKDNGIGIPPEFHDKIFVLFKRLHPESEYEGTGIGLGLCLKIAHKYNGEIRLESQLDTGTTFRIDLPRTVLAPINSQL